MIALILSLTLSYLLTIRLYQPICSIVSLIRSLSEGNSQVSPEISGNELSFIQQIINSAYHENRLLHVLYEKNKPFLMDNLLNSLVSGKLSAQDAVERCEELGLSMSGSQYSAVVLELNLYGTRHLTHRQDSQIKTTLDELALEQGKDLFPATHSQKITGPLSAFSAFTRIPGRSRKSTPSSARCRMCFRIPLASLSLLALADVTAVLPSLICPLLMLWRL